MSPIIARAAMRSAAAAATTSSRIVVPKRNFSIVQSLRTFGRSLESHPFERLPVTSKSAAADWGKQLKRTGKTAVVYFPAMLVMLGWPYAASAVSSPRQ